MSNRIIAMLILILSMIVLNACSGSSSDVEQSHAELPKNFQSYPEIVDMYMQAAEYADVISYMPCYCGCEENGHTSNLSCFVDEMDENGRVLKWDNMGAG